MAGLSIPVRVAVVFGPGLRVRPVWFDLDRQKHTIRQITNSWQEGRGDQVFMYFHVTDDGSLFELVYNMADATWRLERIEAL